MRPSSLFDKGLFLLDIEVELAWGIMTKPRSQNVSKQKLDNDAKKIRERLDDVLEVLRKYQVPVTWGLLGHAILDRCERGTEEGSPHQEMPRAPYLWMKKDWYWFDPCKKVDEEPAFYGKDITDRIVAFSSRAEVEHDIACHSFSHQLFGDPNCTEEVAEAEVRKCIQLLEDNYSVTPEVFIFPRNSPGHIAVLRRNGFKAFRGAMPSSIAYSESKRGLGNALRRNSSLALQLFSFYLEHSPPAAIPSKENGLVEVPPSLCYSKPAFIPQEFVVAKAKKGIRRAVKDKQIFHLFTHDINFGTASDFDEFFAGFAEILKYAHAHLEKNQLEFGTMRKIAENFHE